MTEDEAKKIVNADPDYHGCGPTVEKYKEAYEVLLYKPEHLKKLKNQNSKKVKSESKIYSLYGIYDPYENADPIECLVAQFDGEEKAKEYIKNSLIKEDYFDCGDPDDEDYVNQYKEDSLLGRYYNHKLVCEGKVPFNPTI